MCWQGQETIDMMFYQTCWELNNGCQTKTGDLTHTHTQWLRMVQQPYKILMHHLLQLSCLAKENWKHTQTHTEYVWAEGWYLMTVSLGSAQITWRLSQRLPADWTTFILSPRDTHTCWVWVSQHRGRRGCWKLAFWQVLTLIIHDDAEPQTPLSQL